MDIALWPENERAIDLYHLVVSGFVMDFGLMSVVLAPHLPDNEDDKTLLLRKLGMIYANDLEIQKLEQGD